MLKSHLMSMFIVYVDLHSFKVFFFTSKQWLKKQSNFFLIFSFLQNELDTFINKREIKFTFYSLHWRFKFFLIQ